MIRWMLNTPMVKAYVLSTLSYCIPTMLVTIAIVFYMGGTGDSVARVQHQAGAAAVSGRVETSKVTARVEYRNSTSLWAALLFVITISGGAFTRATLGRRTMQATEQLVADAQAAADGDLRVGSAVTIGNEYGELQRGFGLMIGAFRETVTRIETAASDLTQAAGEMAYTSDEAGHAVGEVAQAIGAISEGAVHQVRLVGDSADLIAAIERSIADTSEHAHEAQRQSAETEQLSEQGAQLAAEVQAAMQDVRESSLNTAGVVRSLGAKSRDIDQIVQVISAIAGQTNMLALNASIEAARAGEQGRGFANVAEEVRLLAEEAHSAAERIASLIREIQGQTEQAVAAMEAGVVRVEDGFETINRNRRTFADISEAVHALNESAGEISQLADGIAAGAGQVRVQIDQVAAVAEQSSASTEQVSASTEQTSAASQQVSASAQRVADTAAGLAELAGHFKLPGHEETDSGDASTA